MMSGGGQATMRCYYEVLEVERNASADELKKAYRKKALLWHPDRNIHQPELAHERFQELQQAYDVLSDPHERAWYDDHREAILRGGDGTAEEGAEHGINLWPFFNNSCFSGYNDGPKGFYTVYGGLFAKLAEEEEEAAASKKQKNGSPAAPAFGDLSTPYPAVKEFYSHWLNFVTQKNFAWCDQYKTTEAPNRQIRRLMEKENKKCRDKERRLFNEQVRHLVEHVRKKDKRVIEHLIKTKQETEQKREKELLRKKQQEEERQAARELQEAEELQHLENFQEEWDKLGLDDIYSPEELSRGKKKNKKGKSKGKDVQAAADAVDAKHMDGEAELFCPACKKSFKSERSYQNHEKSKKHLANVKKLERELLEAALAAEDEDEDEEAEEEEDEGAKGEEDMQKHGNDSEHSEEFVVLGDADSSSEKEQREADGQESEDDEEEEWEMLLRYQQQSRRFSTGSQDEEEEEEEAKNEEDEGSADTDVTSNTNEAKEQEENESAPESSAKENGLDEGEEEEVEAKITKETAKPFTKKERRMLRKMRKKDSRAATNSSPAPSSSSSEDNALRCKTCSVTFRSRNKLFQHIKQTGHAAFKK